MSQKDVEKVLIRVKLCASKPQQPCPRKLVEVNYLLAEGFDTVVVGDWNRHGGDTRWLQPHRHLDDPIPTLQQYKYVHNTILVCASGILSSFHEHADVTVKSKISICEETNSNQGI
ncbi:hypothetical protein M0R45_024196 [Rubus argutus]|uniref:Endonuclease/exonuclease/phosphatase domain-containing protein n=1 Tax=Rubus argutus TaxID=59490 RepID=A0AAW1WQF2_RUBAR